MSDNAHGPPVAEILANASEAEREAVAERVPWCESCEGFAVPTDDGECGVEVLTLSADESQERRRSRRADDE